MTENDLAKCACRVCNKHIEFARERSGETIGCPHCGSETELFIPYQAPEQKKLSAKVLKGISEGWPAPPPDASGIPSGALYCPNCGILSKPKRATKGSFAVELVLWLLFLLPGLVYSIWRITNRPRLCPNCGSPHMIPPGSPRAQRLIQEDKSAGSDPIAIYRPEPSVSLFGFFLFVSAGVVIYILVASFLHHS